MDPQKNLEHQLDRVARITKIENAIDARLGNASATDEELLELAELAFQLSALVSALHTWIHCGGFLPRAWAAWDRSKQKYDVKRSRAKP